MSVAKRGKPAILTERIAAFVGRIRPILEADGPMLTPTISGLWNEELRHHFDSGRTAPTITLYVAKYRAAIRQQLGAESRALAICNTKALKARLAGFIKAGAFPVQGKAATIEERIERAGQSNAGRHPSLLLNISDFITALNGVTDEAAQRALWAAAYDSYRGKARATVISYTTKYRNAVREAFGDAHPMLKIAACDPALYDEARAEKLAKINEKNGALVTFRRWREALALCVDKLDAADPMQIAVGLMGVTGRRPFEIFTQAEFSPAPYGAGVSKWSVMFSGQAKTKGRPGTKFGQTYEIPVLAPARHVLETYSRFRATSAGRLWHGMALHEFEADARIALRNLFTELFSGLWPVEVVPTPYGLRHLYGEIAHHQFAPRTVSKNSYLAAILGHTNNDLESSLSYMTFCLPEEEEDASLAARRLTDRAVNRFAEIREGQG